MGVWAGRTFGGGALSKTLFLVYTMCVRVGMVEQAAATYREAAGMAGMVVIVQVILGLNLGSVQRCMQFFMILKFTIPTGASLPMQD